MQSYSESSSELPVMRGAFDHQAMGFLEQDGVRPQIRIYHSLRSEESHMHNTRRVVFWTFVYLLVIGVSLSQAAITIGVNAHRGPEYVKNRWTKLGVYLSEELGQEVKIKPLKVSSLILDVRRQKIDFVFANPVQTVRLKKSLQASPLVTLNTKAGSQFAGVIVARNGSELYTSEDLRGKSAMSMRFKVAAGGYIFQTYHLLQRGIDPHKDFSALNQLKSQVKLLEVVKRGVADAAFVRAGLLEKMVKAGKFSMDDFIIIDRQEPNDTVPFVHTTAAYPEWYISAMPSADAVVKDELQAALLALTADNPAAKVAKIRGFVEPLSLEGLETALKALKVPPFHRKKSFNSTRTHR